MARDKTNLSPITEGNCPKCDMTLKFDNNDRTEGNEVLCPGCKKTFNINDAKKTKVNTFEDQKGKTRKITIIIIGVILGYFLIGWICCSTVNEEDTREKDYMINGEEKIQAEKEQPQKVEKTQIEEQEEVVTHQSKYIDVHGRDDQVDIAHPRWESIDTSKSSFIKGSWYDKENLYMVMDLDIKNYQYCGIPGSIWTGYKSSSSLGTYYNQSIKGNYQCHLDKTLIPNY